MKFDSATTEFMEKVADESQPSSAHGGALAAAKKVVRVIQDPKTALPKMLIGATTKELLKEGGMSPLEVFGVLNTHYGRLWWDWEPETIWGTLQKEQGIQPDSELKNMLMAFQVIVNTNAPFEHWHVFEKVSHALNRNPVEFQVLQPAELDEIALTMKVLKEMRSGVWFEPEIYVYTAASAINAGVVFLPSEFFGEAQASLDELQKDKDPAKELAKHVSAKWPKKAQGEAAAIQHGYLEEIAKYVEKNA